MFYHFIDLANLMLVFFLFKYWKQNNAQKQQNKG